MIIFSSKVVNTLETSGIFEVAGALAKTDFKPKTKLLEYRFLTGARGGRGGVHIDNKSEVM